MIDQAKDLIRYVEEINTPFGTDLTDVVDIDEMGRLLYANERDPDEPPMWRRNYYSWSPGLIEAWNAADDVRKEKRKQEEFERAAALARPPQ